MKNFKPKLLVCTGNIREFNGRAKIEALYKKIEWIKFSRRFLEINPKCYSCGENSQVVDHIIPHKGKIELFEKEDNMLPLCVKCHNTVTAKFDKNGGAKKYEDKLRWLFNNRVRNEVSVRVKVIPYIE